MKKQVPRKTIKKKEYQRSKWDDFNKVKVTFVLKQFRLNLLKYTEMLKRLGYDGESVTTSPLTKWFLSLPKTQGRSQEIVRLAFVHNYGYEWGKGTQIKSFKDGKNPFFNQYLRIQKSPTIGIDNINIQRQKHRQILRYTTDSIIQDYITKTNQRNQSRRQRFTKKDIKQDKKEEFFLELKKFFNQLVREPTKEEIAQEYQDPEEFDEFEKEYLSEGEWGEGEESQEEVRVNPQAEKAMSILGLMVSPQVKCESSAQIISKLIRQYDQGYQSENDNLQYVPSPIQSRKKSLSLSQFDASPCLSLAQSQDQFEKIEEQVFSPRKLKKTLSEESERMMLKKMSSMNLCMTDQQFEECQKFIAYKRRERDLCDWMDQ